MFVVKVLGQVIGRLVVALSMMVLGIIIGFYVIHYGMNIESDVVSGFVQLVGAFALLGCFATTYIILDEKVR